MKKRLSKPRFLLAILMLLLTGLLLAVVLPVCKIRCTSLRFKAFYNELFRQEMLSDTLSMHYTLAKPENYGIYHYSPVLYGVEEDSVVTASSSLERLQEISRAQLSPEEQYEYDCLKHTLRLRAALESFEYYIEPCSLNGGSLTNLMILLSEYSFYREQDVKEYLSLLAQTGKYLEHLMDYEQERDRRGLSYSEEFYQDTASISKQLATLAPRLLNATFSTRLEELSLSESKKADYQKKHAVLASKFLSKGLLTFAEQCSGLGQERTLPLCSLENGRTYYTYLLEYKTGVSATPETLVRALSKDIKTLTGEIKKLFQNYNPSDYALLLKEPKPSLSSDAKALLASLEQELQPYYPKLTNANPLIKVVSPGMEAISAPAFYLSTPIDDTKASVIYINPESTCTPLELCTTLAHEGFPGHLYQDLYQHQARGIWENKLFTLLNFTGYCEAWALYNEFSSFSLIANQAKQQGNPLLADQIRLEALQRRLSMAVLSLSDILIHYYGMNQEAMEKTISGLGYTAQNLEQVYEFLLENPVYYPTYYVSYLGLLDLRSHIKEEAGASFTPFLFHSYYLENGPAPFSLMKGHFSLTE